MKHVALICGLALLGACGDETSRLLDNAPEAPGSPSAAEIALVKQVLSGLQARSFAGNREYCGYIGYTSDGILVATPAARGDQGSCLAHEPPAEMRVTASYHTHGAATRDYDSEVPSLGDLISDIAEGVNGYIATPGGRVWLNLAHKREARLLCDLRCIAADPGFDGDTEFPAPAPVYTLESLKARGAE